jgi:hypothetical protein
LCESNFNKYIYQNTNNLVLIISLPWWEGIKGRGIKEPLTSLLSSSLGGQAQRGEEVFSINFFKL